MSSDRDYKTRCLIERFFPGYIEGDADPPYERVTDWLEVKVRPFFSTALALIARIQPILDELSARTGGAKRLICRIDDSSLVKTPESILDKMTRKWEPANPDSHPQVSFESFTNRLEDLGRFRIVANFLSDVEQITKELSRPYQGRGKGLSDSQRLLKNEFMLQDPQFEDSILQAPRERTKGERCCRGVFYPSADGQSNLKVEVQIQTMLQEAWDKKDHFLVFEPRRRGEAVALEHEAEIFAMSELLYVADLTFERLRKDIADTSKKGKGVGNATA